MIEQKPTLRVVYQEAGDALYMYLLPGAEVHRTVAATEDITLDFNAAGKVIGIEVLGFMALDPRELQLVFNKYSTFNPGLLLNILQQVRESIEKMQPQKVVRQDLVLARS